ncbi:MFS transporter [Sphingomonas donggukensis]|uniref:MFS transporter n=1 Tax=Sphingomonas donggukensis TaxID=2949093 RepID=A0ABY4TV81_9SPHN|nr:MFS transporter [Sphingomonas donggukensis]URW75079.1 MFS transporter [Sphingomonas donggukensis]
MPADEPVPGRTDAGPAAFVDARSGYRFQAHELPLLPGSPANPDHPSARKTAYLAIGVLLGLVGGAQNGFLLANTAALQATLDLTPVDAGWLTVAFYSTYACMSMLLFRVRQEWGIQPFARWAMAGLVAANLVQLLQPGLGVELTARAIAGIVASGLSALSLYYLMQGLPAKMRLAAIVLSVGLSQVAFPLARALSPALLIDGQLDRILLFQFGLSLLALGSVFLLRLPPGIRQKTFEPLDIVSFALFLIGVTGLCAFLVQGRIQWWDTPWLGQALALAILSLGACAMIELNRASPMLDLRWLSSRNLLALALVAASVRVLVAEQGFGATGLLSSLGYGADQLTGYLWVLTGATVAGIVVSVLRLDPRDLVRPVLVAILIIAVAAFADTRTGVMTRPQDLFWTQGAIAFAAVFAVGPVMMEGMLRALAAGTHRVVSFIAMFSLSQSLGGLAGTAALSAFHTIRLKTHLIDAGQTLTLSNQPLAGALANAARRVAPVQIDPALQQQSASASVTQEIGRQAAVLAFNDVFFLVGTLASLAFVAVLVPWAINRIQGRNPLAKELALLQSRLTRTPQ